MISPINSQCSIGLARLGIGRSARNIQPQVRPVLTEALFKSFQLDDKRSLIYQLMLRTHSIGVRSRANNLKFPPVILIKLATTSGISGSSGRVKLAGVHRFSSGSRKAFAIYFAASMREGEQSGWDLTNEAINGAVAWHGLAHCRGKLSDLPTELLHS